MELAPNGEPLWLVERRTAGDALVLKETGKRVEDFPKAALRDVLGAHSYARPPRLWSQDKSTLVREVQRWVLSEREGSSILGRLKEIARG